LSCADNGSLIAYWFAAASVRAYSRTCLQSGGLQGAAFDRCRCCHFTRSQDTARNRDSRRALLRHLRLPQRCLCLDDHRRLQSVHPDIFLQADWAGFRGQMICRAHAFCIEDGDIPPHPALVSFSYRNGWESGLDSRASDKKRLACRLVAINVSGADIAALQEDTSHRQSFIVAEVVGRGRVHVRVKPIERIGYRCVRRPYSTGRHGKTMGLQ